jgi:hypothetical protein
MKERNMKTTKYVVYALLLFSQVLFAKTIFFDFDVNSSGPEIYPCNAGIVHHKQKAWCHVKGTTMPCSPDFIPDSQRPNGSSPQPPCICTGESGSSVLDFLRFTASKWDDREWSDEFIKSNVKGIPNSTIPSVVEKIHGEDNIVNEFQTQIEQLSINLSSERYGAEYFVDFCYRGPQIEYYVRNYPYWSQRAPFFLHSYVTMTSLSPEDSLQKTYVSLASPAYGAEIVCDLQGEGKYKFGSNSLISAFDPYAKFDTFEMDLYESKKTSHSYYLDRKGLIKGFKSLTNSFGTRDDKIKFKMIKNWQQFTENVHMYYPFGDRLIPINGNTSHTPRFCKVRFYFREGLLGERAWQRHDARVAIKLLIEERE